MTCQPGVGRIQSFVSATIGETVKYSKSQAIEDAIKRLLSMGWTIKSTKRHVRIESPDGKIVTTAPKTPSDWRSEKNWFSQNRKRGVPV